MTVGELCIHNCHSVDDWITGAVLSSLLTVLSPISVLSILGYSGMQEYQKGLIPLQTEDSVKTLTDTDDEDGMSLNAKPVHFSAHFETQDSMEADQPAHVRHSSVETSKSVDTALMDTATSPIDRSSTWTHNSNARQALISALSSLYAMLLVIMSLGFEVSIIAVDSVNGSKYDFFYIYLYSAALLFMAYCYAFLLKNDNNYVFSLKINWKWWRKSSKVNMDTREGLPENFVMPRRSVIMSMKRKITHSAKGAGSLYLRLGCVVFGVVGLISKGLHIFSALDDNISCINASTITETALAGIFIFVQMFFVFENSKLVIHRFKSMARIGFMHLIATNLCMWIRSLVEEQFAIMKEYNEGLHERNHNSSHIIDTASSIVHATHSSPIARSSTPTDSILESMTSYEEPIIDPCPESINYAHHRHAVGALLADVKPFMTTCIIEYSLICSATIYILWRHIGHVPKLRVRQRKQRFHVDCSSSTRGLFVGLLFMVFTIISMLVFFTKIRSRRNYEAMWIFYASDAALYLVSIAAVVIAMVRVRKLYYVAQQQDIVLLDDILLIVGLLGQLMFCVFSIVPLNNGSLTATLLVVTIILRMVEVLLQTIFIFFGQRLVTLQTEQLQDKKPGRELVTFLLLTNLSMFLINTFETQKAGSNPLMHDFYGTGIWTVIVHSTTPLSIFYRFHSTVCLAEIWKQAYRVKESGNSLSFG